MGNRHTFWCILVACILAILFRRDAWRDCVALGIVVAVSFTVLVCKPYQTPPATSVPTGTSLDIPGPSSSGGFFTGAHGIVINNSTMVEIRREDKTSRIMELLLNHIIIGAAHDDSARNYPPKCHPGTRVKILERLTAWFYNVNRVKSLLWLSGPAGVGKSAIVQTFAESVENFVASVFVSRPNKRNDPNLIFTTIAYQLAVHISTYREYVVDLIATNPDVLNKNMKKQFQVFIIEPFVERKIGADGPPLVVLLDGLDEVEGMDAQRDIVRLISMFTQEHPNSPLAWIIASRPEPHISSAFNDIPHESEFIPIDSTQACSDVELFLRDSFDSIRYNYPSTTHRYWPEETAIAKLAAAASGLFIFAETAVRYIRDPDHANPIPRLKLVLSVVDRCKIIAVKERPFELLDNLYTEILSNIPLGLLPTMKLLVRMTLSFRSNNSLGLPLWSKSRTLRGMTMILKLDHHTVYAALNKCFSTLRIPPWEEAHEKRLTFLHASFADYLMDSKRSGQFYIDIDGVEDDILLFYLDMWHKYFEGNPNFEDDLIFDLFDLESDGIAPAEIVKFNTGILENMAGILLTQMVERHKPQPVALPALQAKRFQCLNSLRKVNMIRLCYSKYLEGDHLTIYSLDPRKHLFAFASRTFKAWQEFPHELVGSGLLHPVSFKDIKFDSSDKESYKVVSFVWEGADSSSISHEESVEAFLRQSPQQPVLVCGVVPDGQIALFQADGSGTRYCVVPYCE